MNTNLGYQDNFWEPFFKALKLFVSKLNIELENEGFLPDVSQIDHVCYRVPNLERYFFLKKIFENKGFLLSEATINGRPIATYKLEQPIHVCKGVNIDIIEIPAPKPGRDYPEGFEHIEVVTKTTLELFMQKHSRHSFVTDNIGASINRDISLKFKTGLVKFHEQTLENIIAFENEVSSNR